VQFVGCVGEDTAGEQLRALLVAEGVDITHLRAAAGQATGVALIVVDDTGGNTIVVAAQANDALLPEHVPEDVITGDDVLLTQLEVPVETVTHALRLARAAGATAILNPAPARHLPREVLDLVDVLVANETEADVVGGEGACGLVVTTLGARGARAGTRLLPAFAVDAVDPTGAGDAFCGALAAALAAGGSMDAALLRAGAAGAAAVAVVGAVPSLPTRAEVDRLLAQA
jgi:ribokinase